MASMALALALALLAAIVALLFSLGPTAFQWLMLKTRDRTLPPISEEHRRIHEAQFVIDLHADTLMFKRDFLGGRFRRAYRSSPASGGRGRPFRFSPPRPKRPSV